LHDPHAATAAAEGRLDDEGKANRPRDLERFAAVRDRLFRSGQSGDVHFLRESAGRDLVAHRIEHLGIGSDELQAGLAAGAGKVGVFGEETVAGVYERDALFLRNADDALDVEVSADGALFLAKPVGFVRLEAVAGKAVLLGVDGDGAQAQFGGSAENPDGDFAPVHGHQLFNAGGFLILGFRHGPRL